MKKIKTMSSVLAACIMAAMFTSPAAAMTAVGDVSVPYGTPNIDGTISEGEWDEAAKIELSSKNAKAWEGIVPDDFNTNVSVLWDESGLYIAGEVTDSAVKQSSDGQYNGDAFQVSIDMGQYFATTNENRAIFYSWGYNENKPMIQRQESKNDAVMYNGEGVTVNTVKSDNGWNFEIELDWDTLTNDAKLKGAGDLNVSAGFKLNAMFCYLDYDANGQRVNMFGTTKTDESVAYDWGPKDHGVTFTLAAKETPKADNAPATADFTALIVLAAAASGAALAVIKRRN